MGDWADALMFAFTASLVLWRNLTPVDVAIVMVVLFGAAAAVFGAAD